MVHLMGLIHAIIPINVLVICDFNMKFAFVWAKWEGVTHGSKVLVETMKIQKNSFPYHPQS